MKYQGFLYELFQVYAVKWLCDQKRLNSFELTLTILQGYLNFNVADVTTNVVDIMLCKSLPSIKEKSASLYCPQSYKAREANILCYYE